MIESRKVRNLVLASSIVVSLCIIVFNIYLIVVNETITPLENALLTILFFIASISFSGLFTYISAENSFKQSQKEFGYSAYRRTKELEQFIDLYQISLEEASDVISSTNDPIVVRSKFFSLKMLSEYIRSTINSSIDDWSQIIGEDLEKISKIEEYSVKLEELQHEISLSNEVDNQKYIDDRIIEVKREIESLESQIPSSMHINVKKSAEDIELIRNQLSGGIPLGVDQAKQEQRSKEAWMTLSSIPFEMEIKLTSKLVDRFYQADIQTLLQGETLRFVKEKGFYGIHLENSRGQKVGLRIERVIASQVQKLLKDALEYHNLTLEELEAEVLYWSDERLKGRVLVRRKDHQEVANN